MIKSIPQRIAELSDLDKWIIYVAYLRRYFEERFFGTGRNLSPEALSWPEFCDNNKVVEIGAGWKEQGYAAESWIDYPHDSLGYWIVHQEKFWAHRVRTQLT